MEDNSRTIKDKLQNFETDYHSGDWEMMSARLDTPLVKVHQSAANQGQSLLAIVKSQAVLIAGVASLIVMNLYLIKNNSDLNNKINALEKRLENGQTKKYVNQINSSDSLESKNKKEIKSNQQVSYNAIATRISPGANSNKDKTSPIILKDMPVATTQEQEREQNEISFKAEFSKPDMEHHHDWKMADVLKDSTEHSSFSYFYMNIDSVPVVKKVVEKPEEEKNNFLSESGVKMGFSTYEYDQQKLYPSDWNYRFQPTQKPSQNLRLHIAGFTNIQLYKKFKLRMEASFNLAQLKWKWQESNTLFDIDRTHKQITVSYEIPVMLAYRYKRIIFLSGLSLQNSLWGLGSERTHYFIYNGQVTGDMYEKFSSFKFHSPQLALTAGIEADVYKKFFVSVRYVDLQLITHDNEATSKWFINYSVGSKF